MVRAGSRLKDRTGGFVPMLERRGSPDLGILFTVLTLLGLGVIMVLSSSSIRALWQYNDSYFYLKRQLAWSAIGLAAMVLVMNINYWHLQRWAKGLMLLGLAGLVVVLVPGVGIEYHEARRWLGLGSISFQPSELMKLIFVIFLADHLTRIGDRVTDFFRGIVPIVVILGVVFLLILLEPDLGTAVAITGTVAVMLFAAGSRLLHLFLLGAGSVPLLLVAVFSADYRRRRFFAFLDPWSERLGSGYHIIQSLYALGSGGIFGVGLGRSRQKWFYLPEQHTDFIFAVLAEELGFLGGVTVIVLFFFLAWRGYRVALTIPDRFGSLLAVGITTMITLQALINIGVVTGSIPITGIPLPFLSYGGSSLVFTLTGVGILLNISKHTVH